MKIETKFDVGDEVFRLYFLDPGVFWSVDGRKNLVSEISISMSSTEYRMYALCLKHYPAFTFNGKEEDIFYNREEAQAECDRRNKKPKEDE